MAGSESWLKLAIAILAVVLLLLQYRLWFSSSGWPEVFALDKAVATQEAENTRMMFRNRALEAEVNDLKHGEDAVEERARTELLMIRQGETLYQIGDQENEQQVGSNAEKEQR